MHGCFVMRIVSDDENYESMEGLYVTALYHIIGGLCSCILGMPTTENLPWSQY